MAASMLLERIGLEWPIFQAPMAGTSTPANWKQGEDIILTGAITPEEADKLYPGYKQPRPWIRIAPQPRG